jgi:hypothetical protein
MLKHPMLLTASILEGHNEATPLILPLSVNFDAILGEPGARRNAYLRHRAPPHKSWAVNKAGRHPLTVRIHRMGGPRHLTLRRQKLSILLIPPTRPEYYPNTLQVGEGFLPGQGE